MKKKLFSVLLALTLCGSLAVPVFAGPAEEPPVPEESEVLTGEEAQNLPDPAMENGESKGVEEAVYTYGHLHCLEEVVDKDGVTWQYGYQCSDKACPYLQNMQITDTLSATLEEPYLEEPYIVCRACNSFNWGPEMFYKIEYFNTTGDPTTHKEYYNTIFYCQTVLCDGYVTKRYPSEEVAHSWSKGSIAGYESNATTHTAMYNYSCKCGAEKAELEAKTEAHSLDKYDFGRNYHKGTLHYVEWYCRCFCGYETTKLESQPCPGNDNGEGCIFGINKVNPPVEVQDVTEPEDVTTPEETT